MVLTVSLRSAAVTQGVRQTMVGFWSRKATALGKLVFLKLVFYTANWIPLSTGINMVWKRFATLNTKGQIQSTEKVLDNYFRASVRALSKYVQDANHAKHDEIPCCYKRSTDQTFDPLERSFYLLWLLPLIQNIFVQR